MADYSKLYSTVITQAINDFDSIQGTLRDKNVVDGSGNALNENTTGVATSEYAGLIANQLFRVTGKYKSDLTLNANGEIPYLGTLSLTSGTVSYTTGADGTKTANITLNGGQAVGYIDGTKSTINISGIATTPVSLSGALDKKGGTNYTYVAGSDGALGSFKIEKADGIIGSVSIAEGKADIHVDLDSSHSTDSSNVISVNGAKDGTINSKILSAVPEGEKADGYELFELSALASGKDRITANFGGSSTAPGYISEINLPGDSEKQKDVDFTQSGNQTFYLKKGIVENVKASGGQIAFDSNANGYFAADAEEGYAITASLENLAISGNISEGYVKGGTITGNVEAATKTVKIKKGSVAAGSTTINLKATSDIISEGAGDAGDYSITIDRDLAEDAAENTTLTITPGYVKATSVTDVITTNGKTYHVKKGAATATAALTGISYTDAGNILANTTVAGSDYYEITPKVSVSNTKNVTTNGYITNAEVTATGLTDEVGNSVFVKHGKVTLNHGLSFAASDTGRKYKPSEVRPESGKYLTISTAGQNTVVEGYIKNDATDVVIGANKNYYIPEAKFEYVADSSSGANFIKVSSFGYVAPGNIGTISGSIDNAVVKGTLSATEGLTLSPTLPASGGYELTLGTDTVNSNAGFFSPNNNNISFNGQYYIAKGRVSVAPSITGIAFTDITRDTKGGFVFTATASGSNGNPTTTEGYTTSADVKVSDIADEAVNHAIPEASLAVGLDAGESAKLSTSGTGVLRATETSSYVVTPALSGSNGNLKIKASVTKAGYVDTASRSSEGTTLTVDEANISPFYIKAGTTKSTTTATHTLTSAGFTNNFASTNTGDYTITVSQTATKDITLDEGYYGNAEKTIPVNIPISGTYSVAHGKATITASSVKITHDIADSTFMKITNLGAGATESDYYKITTGTNGLTASVTAVTPGYMKASDITAPTSITATADGNLYIQKYSHGLDRTDATHTVATGTVDDGENKDVSVYLPGTAGNFVEEQLVIHTAHTYVDKDIAVKLGANAAGTNVIADLSRLKSRLAGTLAKSAA